MSRPGDANVVDVAKRDRPVQPGDICVAVPSTFVSDGDLRSVKKAHQVMYEYQDQDDCFRRLLEGTAGRLRFIEKWVMPRTAVDGRRAYGR